MADPVGEAYVRLRPSGEGFASATKRLLSSIRLPPQTGIKTSLDGVSAQFKDVTAAARAAASTQVAESMKVQNTLRAEALAYRAVATAAVSGSREQMTATNLAINAEQRLQRELNETVADEKRAGAAAAGRSARGGAGGFATGAAFGGIARGAAAATLGFAGVAGAITAATLAFKGIVVAGADFEQQLNVFQAVSSATADQMARVGQEAKALGQDVKLPGVSAADAAASMLELAKGGLTVQQSMDAARGTLQLAKAANVDFGTAAQITARNLSAFGLSGDQATKVADLLAGASIAATGEVSDMAIALQQSAGAAKIAGVGLDDTVVAIAELAKNGLVGSDAGTSLRTMLLRLLPQTKKAAEKMSELGVKVLDMRGSMLPLPQIMENYRRALAPLSQAQKQMALNTIFGQDAIRSAKFLTDEGSAGYERMAKVVTKVGQASILTTAQTKGLSGSFGALQSNLETVGISVAQRINPAIKSIVDGLNNGLTWVTTNWPRLEAAITPTIDRIVASVQTNWPKVHETILNVLQSVADIVHNTVVIVTVLWERFGKNILSIIHTDFVATLSVIRSTFQIIASAFDTIANVLTGKWDKAWTDLKDIAVAGVKTLYKVIWGNLNIFNNVGVAIVNLIRDGFNAAFHALEEDALRAVEKLLQILNKIPTRFDTHIPHVGKVGVKNPAGAALEAVRAQLAGLRGRREAGQIADAFATNTAAALSAKNRDITTAVTFAVSDAVDKSVVKIKDPVVAAGKTVGKALTKGVASGLNGPGGITDTAKDAIAGLQKRLKDAITDTADKVKQAVISAQQNLTAISRNLATDLDRIVEEGPLGKTLKRLEDQLAGRQAHSQSQQLRDTIKSAVKDLASARASIGNSGALTKSQQGEVNKFLRPKKEALSQARAAWKDFTQQTVVAGLQGRIEEQKTAVQNRLNVIVDEFNRGAINLSGFQKRIAALISARHDQFAVAGRKLGGVFAREFNDQIAGLLGQAKAIQTGRNKGIPGFLGAGTAATIVEPLKVMNDQLKVQREIRDELRKTRLRAESAAQARAVKAAVKAAVAAEKAAKKSTGGINLSDLMTGSTG